MEEQIQRIFHHYDNDGVRISAKVEKNTKGFNYEATVSGAQTVKEAMATLKEAQLELEKTYGTARVVED
jgi:hypothetical protein